jgi:glutathione S-transferase
LTRAVHPFTGATLFLSARSPFARRVRVALLEAGVSCAERLEDVLRPSPELLQANPFGRVPTLRLASGEVLVESQLILERLWEACAPDPAPLRPREAAARLRADAASGLAIGVCEKAVEWFFEGLRPPAHRDPELLAEIQRGLDGALDRLEAALAPGPFLLGEAPCTGDVDVAIALDYVSLRLGRAWEERRPRLRALATQLAGRESLRRTAPPPP